MADRQRKLQNFSQMSQEQAAEFACASISAADLQTDAACAGWLFKRSEHRRKWNKRWCVLWPRSPEPGCGRFLVYFNKPTDAAARGCYALVAGQFNVGIDTNKKHSVCLVLTTNAPKRWDVILQRVVLAASEATVSEL